MPRQKRRQSRKTETKPCTYELGYVRQDLYGCRQCTVRAENVPSAFCRSCREVCHADHIHEVFEMYTKRNFRCDCGNKRAGNVCRMNPEKDEFNIGNEQSYSHNFLGRYCRCDREYDVRLAMAQCAMCEDWFHEKCYKLDKEASTEQPYDFDYEFTCNECVKKLPVLAEYYDLYGVWQSIQENANSLAGTCIRPKDGKPSTQAGSVDYMWQNGFRLSLCKCSDCMDMYEAKRVLYIVERNDFLPSVREVEDTELLGPNSPAKNEQIIEDLLRESEYGSPRPWKKKDFSKKGLRGPSSSGKRSAQKNPDSSKKRQTDLHGITKVENVRTMRERVKSFIEEAIRTNGASMTRVSLLQYRKDIDALNCVESAEGV